MSTEEAIKRIWQNTAAAIVLFALTSTVTVIVTLRISTAVNTVKIENNTKEIQELKQDVNKNQENIQRELNDIKKMLMTHPTS